MTETSKPSQLRPGLWATINERYPGSMISKSEEIPLAPLRKPLKECRLTFVSTSGVQPKGTVPFDVVHPVGDYTFRRVPSEADVSDLEIHQIKYPTFGANRDLNVIFPIERLRELREEGVIGALAHDFFAFIGYNMDPDRLETTLAEDIAEAVVASKSDVVLLAPA